MRLICLLVLCSPLSHFTMAQNCHCTISDVQNNTVAPCNIIIGTVDTVYNSTELMNAINTANNTGGSRTILLADGTYQIASVSWYPYITASNVVFRSLSGNRDNVIWRGNGMSSVAPQTENGIYFVGNNCVIADMTIRDVGNHGIATHGDNLFVHNVRIQNTFEQMIKGTSAGDGADDGIVQCCLLEYPASVGPQFYIGGLDIHKGDRWVVRDNVFKNIASPSGSLAEHAVHFWNGSSDNTVERNLIINCDRGVGFGLGNSSNDGGMIRNNMIYNDGTAMFDDVGIGLESSPNTKVYNNTIHIQYQNAIEYRFASTTNVDIKNNLCNQDIRSRNGGTGAVSDNIENAMASWYANVNNGDLHLISAITAVVDQGANLGTDVSEDIDKTARFFGTGYDIGAHEFTSTSINELTSNSTLLLYPDQFQETLHLWTNKCSDCRVEIRNTLGQLILISEHELIDGHSVIDIPGLESSVYVCSIYDGLNLRASERFLIPAR